MQNKTYKYLFGPVNSRRLGVSLGVDLAPRKVCSLDCVYCEVGATTVLTTERKEYIPYTKLLKEIDHYMENHPLPDYITLTGSGEPTLHSRFGDVLQYIKSHYPHVKLAVLTNGTLMNDPQVRKELLGADLVMPSLDAISEEGFKKIDKPAKGIDMASYVQGLVDFRKEYDGQYKLEILFLKGYNDNQKEISLLKEAIERIQPDSIQLNTLDRPGVVDGLKALSYKELESIAQQLNYPAVEIVARKTKESALQQNIDKPLNAVLELLKRRPCTLEDIHVAMGLEKIKIQEVVGQLLAQGRVEQVMENGEEFYKFLTHPNKKRS